MYSILEFQILSSFVYYGRIKSDINWKYLKISDTDVHISSEINLSQYAGRELNWEARGSTLKEGNGQLDEY